MKGVPGGRPSSFRTDGVPDGVMDLLTVAFGERTHAPVDEIELQREKL